MGNKYWRCDCDIIHSAKDAECICGNKPEVWFDEGSRDERVATLAEYLEEMDFFDGFKDGYDDNIFISGNQEYMVLTDDEADEKAAEYIKDSLWAFNPSFIIEHSKLPYEAEEMIRGFQEAKCEDANETIEALIDDIDEFIDAAVGADGRGHFLNTYDGEENSVVGSDYFIYRLN